MSMTPRSWLAPLVAVLLTCGALRADGAPLAIGYLSGDDSASFGLTVTVWNDSDVDPELAGGDPFENLTLDLRDATDASIATYNRATLLPGLDPWFAPLGDEDTTTFRAVHRVLLSLTFRGQSITSRLETCLPGDTSNGCFADLFLPVPPALDECFASSETCEPARTAGVLIEYEPTAAPVPEPATSALLALALTGLCRRARSHSRS